MNRSEQLGIRDEDLTTEERAQRAAWLADDAAAAREHGDALDLGGSLRTLPSPTAGFSAADVLAHAETQRKVIPSRRGVVGAIAAAAALVMFVGLPQGDDTGRFKGGNTSTPGSVHLEAVAEGAAVTDLGDGDHVPASAAVVFRAVTDSSGFLYLVQHQDGATTHLMPADGHTWSVQAGSHLVGGESPMAWRPDDGPGLYDYEIWFCKGALRDVPDTAPPGCVVDSLTLTWDTEAP